MKVILDSDIISMFAKADKIDILRRFFKNEIYITPKIRDEIMVPKEYGYEFPDRIISKVDTFPVDKDVLNEYEKYYDNTDLGKGELEAISLCKIKNHLFCTNDSKARKFAKEEGVNVISLQAVLKALWKSETLQKEEVEKLLSLLIEVDKLSIGDKTKRAIFQE